MAKGAQAADGVGLQVLVPSYTFTCSGVITRITIRADVNRGDDGFVFQIWRPESDGTYNLSHSVDTSGSTLRIDSDLIFNTSIPVLNGDTIGYRLEPVSEGEEEMHFILDSSDASGGVEIYRRQTADTVCQLSPCDGNYTMIVGMAPFISVDFGEFCDQIIS